MTMLADQNKPRPFWQHIAIGIALLVLAALLSRFDVSIVNAADPAEWPGDLKRLFALSELFAHTFGIVLIIFGIWHLSPDRRKFIPRLIACAFFPSVTAQIIKLCVARHRPTTFLDDSLVPQWPGSTDVTWLGAGSDVAMNVQYATQSFPSAHAAIVCGMAIGLSFVYPHGRKLFFAVAVIAAIQRVIFFAHWPSDVAVGASLGFLIAGGLVQDWGIGSLCGRFENRKRDSTELHVLDNSPRIGSEQSRRSAA
ncbi:phosphatase PAP2 family protein [Mariniblastus fucicola]|uniref:PAP2 superfamily protein n=1 Tax=Mariniblastus fucicola TaxID=980251 RepID=A0A5B9P5H5_9BACT|nr:phosphatase PAP2 family protein [Mariniblastus fucicola]QEG21827.1 PAP2 superfamily protein [Mariniblastus fucicola]